MSGLVGVTTWPLVSHMARLACVRVRLQRWQEVIPSLKEVQLDFPLIAG